MPSLAILLILSQLQLGLITETTFPLHICVVNYSAQNVNGNVSSEVTNNSVQRSRRRVRRKPRRKPRRMTEPSSDSLWMLKRSSNRVRARNARRNKNIEVPEGKPDPPNTRMRRVSSRSTANEGTNKTNTSNLVDSDSPTSSPPNPKRYSRRPARRQRKIPH